MGAVRRYTLFIISLLISIPLFATEPPSLIMISGVVQDSDGDALPYASIYVDNTTIGTTTDNQGRYTLYIPEGNIRLTAQMMGYTEKSIDVALHTNKNVDFQLSETSTEIDAVVVSASGVGGIRRSAFNAVAVDTKPLKNTTKNLADALANAPGLKLRESGGVGSDMSLMIDGFAGKHVKIFIDGVPQEGVGNAFSLNNIPAGYADRIEVYRGVVPVGFGADALGGVINIVTKKHVVNGGQMHPTLLARSPHTALQ